MEPRVNGAGLRADLSPSVAGLETAPHDAAFTVTGGEPVLVPATSGTGFAPARIATAVEPVLASTANRVATVPIGMLDPSFTTADAQALGVTGVMGSATSTVPTDRTAAGNLARAAARVSGTVLAGGAEFDFDHVVGVPGQVFGAGVSQVSTTVYEASFYAGLAEGRRTPFPHFEAEYPAGLDASVDTVGSDLTFHNDSGNPVYVYAAVNGSTLTVAMLGRPAYDAVRVATSPRTAVVSQGTTVGHGTGCVAVAGEPGFRVTVTRTLLRGGQPVATQPFTTIYTPADTVTCGSSSGQASTGAPTGSPSTSSGSSSSSSSGRSSGGTSTHPPTHTAPPSSTTTTGALGGLLGGL
jgi:vancomycin resistance protein YoaR